jgi:hypothetical protein
LAPIDVNAPVASDSQCMPCHATIGDAKTPGHIFQHGSHMMLSCDACHWAPPHTGGVTVLPSMQSCFNCHGLMHGSTQIVSSDCSLCHTKPRAQLVPADHVAGYAGTPHALDAKADTNRCLMCHTSESCDLCHIKEKVNAPPTQKTYQTLMPNTPRRDPIIVSPKGPVTIGQCVACHPDLDKYVPGRVIFAHATHLQRAYACKDCHTDFAHGPDTVSRPAMSTCYQCHGLVHSNLGPVATEKCSDCHPPGFKLEPADHTAAFVAKGHSVAANASPEQCAMCHTSAFCVSCHQGKPKVPGGPARPQVIPSGHRLASFRTTHGKDFLAQKGACGSCHTSASCEACHVTPMPHPADWTTSHPLAKDLDSNDCKVCHTDRTSCEECHHRNLHGADLVLANCVKCHKVMATVPATSIKPSSIAEHAVHFIVAQKKGKPYKCEQCHIGSDFTTLAVVTGSSQPKQGHDLRSCYQCHGALDYNNVLIAPYPGNALCLKCHTNLGF